MNNLFFYVFILLQFCYQQIKSKSLQKKLLSKTFSQNDLNCLDNIFITNYLGENDIQFQELQIGSLLKKNCPSLRKTCCSNKAFNDIGDRFVQGLKKLNKLKKNLQILHSNFEDLGQINYQNLKKRWEKKSDECQLHRYQQAIYNRLLDFNEFENDFELLFDKLVDHYAGFGCELCQFENYKVFEVTRYYYSINVSFQQVEEFFDIIQLIGKVHKFYLNLIEISQMGYCVTKNKQKYMLIEKFSLSFYAQLQNKIDKCKRSSIAHYDESCTHFVEFIGFFDCLKFFDVKEDFLLELNTGLELLGDLTSKPMKKTGKIFFFGQPLDKDLFNKLSIKYTLQYKNSWNQVQKPNFTVLKKLKSQIQNLSEELEEFSTLLKKFIEFSSTSKNAFILNSTGLLFSTPYNCSV